MRVRVAFFFHPVVVLALVMSEDLGASPFGCREIRSWSCRMDVRVHIVERNSKFDGAGSAWKRVNGFASA